MDTKSRLYRDSELVESNLIHDLSLISLNDAGTVTTTAADVITFDEFRKGNNTVNNKIVPYLNAGIISFTGGQSDYGILPDINKYTKVITTEKELAELLDTGNLTGTYFIKSGEYSLYKSYTVDITGLIIGNNSVINLPNSTVTITGKLDHTVIHASNLDTENTVIKTVYDKLALSTNNPLVANKINIFKIRGPASIFIKQGAVIEGESYTLYFDQVSDIAFPVKLYATYKNIPSSNIGLRDFKRDGDGCYFNLYLQQAGKRFIIKTVCYNDTTPVMGNVEYIPKVSITDMDSDNYRKVYYPTNIPDSVLSNWIGPTKAKTDETITITPVLANDGIHVSEITAAGVREPNTLTGDAPYKFIVAESDVEVSIKLTSDSFFINNMDLIGIASYQAKDSNDTRYNNLGKYRVLVDKSTELETNYDINTVSVMSTVPDGYSIRDIGADVPVLDKDISDDKKTATMNIKMTNSNIGVNTDVVSNEYTVSVGNALYTNLQKKSGSSYRSLMNSLVFIVVKGQRNITVTGATADIMIGENTAITFRQGACDVTISM